MGNWIALVGGIAGIALALRYVAVFVVIIWSLRADERGRRHTIRLLELLSGKLAVTKGLPFGSVTKKLCSVHMRRQGGTRAIRGPA